MIRQPRKFTEPIGLKVTKEQFGALKKLADQNDQPLAEWCRERVLETVQAVPPTVAQCAILAEILAVQDTLVGLLSAMGRDGRLTPQKAKEIVDAAHERKYRDVAALFKDAEAECRRPAR
jgi:hypothetical protein